MRFILQALMVLFGTLAVAALLALGEPTGGAGLAGPGAAQQAGAK